MGAGEQIESNKEHGLGRPDLVIIDKANGKVAIFEVKYSQSMKQLNKDCDKALAQMKERKYAEDYKDRYKDIFCYGISFYKKECLVKMLESQNLFKHALEKVRKHSLTFFQVPRKPQHLRQLHSGNPLHGTWGFLRCNRSR